MAECKVIVTPYDNIVKMILLDFQLRRRFHVPIEKVSSQIWHMTIKREWTQDDADFMNHLAHKMNTLNSWGIPGGGK